MTWFMRMIVEIDDYRYDDIEEYENVITGISE